jgi:hypothetical protein
VSGIEGNQATRNVCPFARIVSYLGHLREFSFEERRELFGKPGTLAE